MLLEQIKIEPFFWRDLIFTLCLTVIEFHRIDFSVNSTGLTVQICTS